MKHRINKMAAIFIASIFALSGLGIAYAAWTDTITITGTVTTGELCWEFTTCYLYDALQPSNPGGDVHYLGSPLADLTCRPGFVGPAPLFWHSDKNVGWGTQLIRDLDGDGCNEILEVTLHNVYPCYFNALAFYVRNCGTIPIKVDHVVVNGVDIYYDDFYHKFDLNNNAEWDFEIQYGNGWGTQIEPGEDSYHEFSFWMHMLQDEDPAIQGQTGTLTFTIEVVCIQWNKY